jgi:HNH endonuclease/MYM-type Zinc finger with FCS sequence motif
MNIRVYGPYERKDGRKHVVIIYDDGRRRTVSYPKWIMEQHLGRELDPDLETIDHIDGDINNNDLSNLRIIPRSQHVKEDVKRVEKIKIKCDWCGKEAEKKVNDVVHNSKQGKHGKFCSKTCAGKYSRCLQLNKINEFEIKDYTYFEKNILYA